MPLPPGTTVVNEKTGLLGGGLTGGGEIGGGKGKGPIKILKVAVIILFEFIVMFVGLEVEITVEPCFQLLKTEPLAGVAVRVTTVPTG